MTDHLLRPKLRVLLVRHGESVANETPLILCGTAKHVDLTATGRLQAETLGLYWAQRGEVIDYAFSSSAIRATETAKICLHAMKSNITHSEHEELLEINRGDWVGRHRDDVYTEEVLKRLDADPWNFAAPNGESQKQVEERMFHFTNTILLPLIDKHTVITSSSNDGTSSIIKDGASVGTTDTSSRNDAATKKHGNVITAAVFGHGYAFKCLLRGILGSSPHMIEKFHLNNTSVTELWFSGSGWHFNSMNETTHLVVQNVRTSEFVH